MTFICQALAAWRLALGRTQPVPAAGGRIHRDSSRQVGLDVQPDIHVALTNLEHPGR